MTILRSSARLAAVVASVVISGPALAQAQMQRLSTWLLQNAKADSYFPGLSWQVPEEEPAQQVLKTELLTALGSSDAPRALRMWISSLPVTGRVPVVFADPRWLMAHPARDPVLLPHHRIVLPPRPSTVTVVTNDGGRCSVTHARGAPALAYVAACGPSAADWVWVVQPDGRVQRFGVTRWNQEVQDEPAPGAWIWAPLRERDLSDRISNDLAQFLATQGPAPDSDAGRLDVALGAAQAVSIQNPPATYYANDWGETGLLQTPTARIRPAGYLTVQISHVWPYTRGNVFVSPFDWMEAGFRYTDVANLPYGPQELSGSQSLKDKSFDVKLRLLRESAYLPQVGVGIRDIAGTGLFSGEYVVGNKRFGAFDWSLGLGWGYVGARSDVANPLRVFGSRFNVRQTDVGEGGSFSSNTYFHGPAAIFGGLQYQTPWSPLAVKIEREGNDYQDEPHANNLPQRTPWNFGITYRLSPGTHLSAGVERGNRLLVGIAFTGNLGETYTPKVSDPPRVAYRSRPASEPDWQVTAAEIAGQTGWRIARIDRSETELRVTVLDSDAIYWASRADRAAAVLNRDAPAEIAQFVFVHRQRGIAMAEHVVNRRSWAKEQIRPVPPYERVEAITTQPVKPAAETSALIKQPRRRFEHGLGPDLQYTLGGPDAFALYQLGIAERLRIWLRDDLWVRGKFRLGLTNNYDRYHYTAPSNLPRVRTYLREYQTTSRFTMSYMQVTHATRLTDNQFFSFYGGYFEEMFGGLGTEWLYRPLSSRTAFGLDMNYARQREFEQDLGFMDYYVITGHGTFYLDTGLKDVLATISVGRYLAGDIGATFQLSRVFRNGVTMGVFATKTNVSAQQFGEGSFDKGVFLSIPFDVLFTRSSSTVAHLAWKPLTRDGGAKLIRQDPLYAVTSVRDFRALWYRPAEKSDNFSITPSQ